MRLLEHQSKQLLAGFGLAFTKSTVITSPDAITGDGPVVLKAQVPFGGRGKAGAVKFASTITEARQAAAELLRT